MGKDEISKKLKTQPERISIFGLKTKFGGGFSSGFALIYNSLEDKKKYDSKCNLRRDGLAGKRKVQLRCTRSLRASKRRCTELPRLRLPPERRRDEHTFSMQLLLRRGRQTYSLYSFRSARPLP